jgi:DNA-binding transcriptional LysR family regulator
MELRRLRYFVAVAEELNFSRAAVRLHISQQGLSAQIRQLEAEVGVALLERTTRRVALTDAGQVLLGKARTALAAVDDAMAAARSAGQTITGPLRLFHYFYVPRVAERLVADLTARHPQVNVATSMLHEDDGVAQVRDGLLDAGFAWWEGEFEGLHSMVVDQEEIIGVVSPDHRLAGAEAFPVEDLARDPVVLFPPSYHARAYSRIRAHYESRSDVPVRICGADFGLEFRQVKMLEAVSGAQTSTVAIRHAFGNLRVPGLVAASLDPPLYAEVQFVWREPAPPVVRALLDLPPVLVNRQATGV